MNDIDHLSAMAYRYAALEPQIGAKIMELRLVHHHADWATGPDHQHLDDEGGFFDAVWRVVNWNESRRGSTRLGVSNPDEPKETSRHGQR